MSTAADQPRSIQRHLAFWLMGVTLLVTLAAGTALYFYVRATLRGQFDSALEAKARALASLAKLEVKENGATRLEFDYPEATMPEFGRGKHPEYFELLREDGSSFRRSPSMDNREPLVSGATRAAAGFRDLRVHGDDRARAVVLHFTPMIDEEESSPRHRRAVLQLPKLTLTLVRESREVDRPLDTLLTALLCTAGVMCVSTAGGVYWTVRRGLRPLRTVADAAARIDIDHLAERFPTDQMPLELRPICDRLNDLLARLEESFIRERRFSADAAHELRTPIAELRSMAEVALKWPGDLAATGKNAEDTLAIARQMERIVTALLSLARCQSGRQSVERREVDLPALLREAWRPSEPLARARQLNVDLQTDGVGTITTDPAMMLPMLSNLLENAATYAPIGGPLTTLLRRQNGSVEILIRNSNDTLTAADLPHVFEPFWRKDPARTSGEHSGLGLPLVQAFARVLGNAISVSLPTAEVFEVRIEHAEPVA